jgi:hypothetical protein
MKHLLQKKGESLTGPVVLGVSLTNEKFEKDDSSRYRFKIIQPTQQSGVIARAGEMKMLGILIPNQNDKLPTW